MMAARIGPPPLTDPAAIAAANQFFNELIDYVGPAPQSSCFRHQVEDCRFEIRARARLPSHTSYLRGFLAGLYVAGALTLQQGEVLAERLACGKAEGWL